MHQFDPSYMQLTRDDRHAAIVHMLEELPKEAQIPAPMVLALLYDVLNQ